MQCTGGSGLRGGCPARARRRVAQLSFADASAPLHPDDLERLAECAQLLGRYADSEALLARLHHASLAAGDSPRAARAAFKLGMSLITQGEVAQGADGWPGPSGCSMRRGAIASSGASSSCLRAGVTC